MAKYDNSMQTPTVVTTVTPRRPGPLERAAMACMSAGLVALILAMLAGRPLDELWRWLAFGVLIPLAAVLIGNLGPLIVEAIEGFTHTDWNRDGVVGKPEPETIRLLPVRAQAPRIRLSGEDDDGYEPDDMAALVHHAYAGRKNHTARSFYGMVLPSGRTIAGYPDVAPFLHTLETAGLLVDRAERKAGRLVGDEDEARDRLGLL
jgi:hypothetical protein